MLFKILIISTWIVWSFNPLKEYIFRNLNSSEKDLKIFWFLEKIDFSKSQFFEKIFFGVWILWKNEFKKFDSSKKWISQNLNSLTK